MASSRDVELIFKITNKASAELQGIRKELEALKGLQTEYSKTRQKTGQLGDEAQQQSKSWLSGLGAVGKAVGAIGIAYIGVRQAIGDALASGRTFYEYFIGSNERLNQQILASAANIANSNKILKDGLTFDDPSEKIKALKPQLEEVLKQIQIDSVDLVGVTSADLNGVFEVLSANVSKFSNQSKQLTDPLKAAGKLTVDFSAAMGTLGIPLFQANQELNTLLSSTADQNSRLAASLFGSATQANRMTEAWRAQGVLVDKLREKLSIYLTANAEGARSISGLTTNIKDQFEIIAREAGQPLLEPVIKGLELVYNFVKDNAAAFQDFTSRVIDSAVKIGGRLAEQISPTVESLVESAKSLASAIAGMLPVATTILNIAVQALDPILNMVEAIAKVLEGVLSTELGKFAVQLGLMVAVALPLANGLLGVGAALITMGANIAGAITLMGGLEAAFVATSASALTTATAIAAVAIPLAAVAAAIGLVAIGLKSMALADSNKAVEEMQSSTNALADEALRYATELKALNDAERENGALTDEQARKRAALQSITSDLSGDIDAQIEELQGLKGSNADINAALDIQIGLLKQRKDLLGRQGAIEITNPDLADFGSSLDLEQKKVNDLKQALSGDVSQVDFDKRVQEFIGSSNSLVESGRVDAEEVQNLLRSLSTDTRLSLEDRQKAEKALSQVVQAESKNRQDALSNEISNIKEQADQGVISRVDAEKRVTELQRQQIQERLSAVNDEIARREAAGESGTALDALKNQAASLTNELDSLAIESQKRLTQLYQDEGQKRVDALASELKAQEALLIRGEITRSQYEKAATESAIAQINARIEATQNALATAQGSEKTKLQQQLVELNTEREKAAVEGAQRVQAAQLKELEQSQDKALDATRLAETQRINELERLRMQEPELAARIDAQIAETRKAGIQEQLRAEQDRLNFLKSQSALTGEAEIERQSQIRDAQQRTADLTGQLVQAEASAQKALTAEIQNEIDKRNANIQNALTAQTQQYERQLQLIEAASKAESTRLELLNAQKDLIQSRGALEQTVYQIAIAATTDENKKAQLQEKAAQAKLKAKVRELAIDAQMFEIQELQRKLDLEAEKIQSRIAQIKSRAALADAQAQAAKTLADPTATDAQKAAALLGVEAAKAGVVGADATAQLTDFKAQVNDQLSGLKREAFQNTQQNELLNARFEAAQAIADPNQRQQAITALSREASNATGVNTNTTVKTVVVGGQAPTTGAGSPVIDGLTASFNQMFGGLSKGLDQVLQGFNLEMSNFPTMDGTSPAGVQNTKVAQNNITIQQVNFTNRIERDSDQGMLDKIRRGITDSLSQTFNEAANAIA